MFDAAQTPGSGCAYDYDCSNETGIKKKQYTVKGVEEATLTLMRDAARKDGMKIGAWISTRMKEAATRSLSQSTPAHLPQESPFDHGDIDLKALVYELYVKRMDAEEKLQNIQAELHEITRSQRTIMDKMIKIMDGNI